MCGYVFFMGKKLTFSEFCDSYMKSNIVERGGDGDNLVQLSSDCFMGHSLFHVTSIDPVFQPLKTVGGYLLFNGEIYNFEELQDTYDLKDLDSDTVLLGRLIEKIGIRETIKIIYGALSITYYDTVNSEVYLYRDIWGQKPLYYWLENEEFAAASSFQFLDNLVGNERSYQLKILYDVFGFSPFGYTLNPKIHSVNPGYLTVINCSRELKITQKSFVTQNNSLIAGNTEYILGKRLRENIPNNQAAIAFSGGIDSSILAMLSYESGCRLPLYNLDIPANINEAKNVLMLTEHYGAELRRINIDHEKLCDDFAINISDHPIENKGIASTAMLANAAHKDGVRVMITGMGADEYFGGYARAQNYESLKDIYTNQSVFQILFKRTSINYKVKLFLMFLYAISNTQQEKIILTFVLLRHSRSRRYLISKFFKIRSVLRSLKISLEHLNTDADLFEQLVHFERYYIMPDFMCLPLDTIAQKYQIEMRSPFLNPDFDALLKQHPSMIYRSPKTVLRKILKKKLNYKFSKKERFQF